MDAAASRASPCPVYAEMGSTNPVFILPAALRERGPQIVAGLDASLCFGVGQLCSKPGILILLDSPTAHALVETLGTLLSHAQPPSYYI